MRMRNTKKEEKEKRKEEKEEDDNAVSLLMSVPLSLRLLSLVFFPQEKVQICRYIGRCIG